MVYCFGTCELHAAPLLLRRAGVVVPLPPKALEILLLLVQNEGKVITKEEIFNKVWPDTHVVESSLTKNISILRKALDDTDQPSHIENLAKRGYRFTLSLNPTIPNKRPMVLFALVAFALISIASFFYFRPKVSLITEADREILIGRHHLHRIQPDEIQKALKRFERAAALEPGSALAQAGIADANLLLIHLGFADPAKALSAARTAAIRCLALDPKLSIAHVGRDPFCTDRAVRVIHGMGDINSFALQQAEAAAAKLWALGSAPYPILRRRDHPAPHRTGGHEYRNCFRYPCTADFG